MILPKLLRLKVHCPECEDSSELILGLTVRAGRKNPYHIYLPKTDANGNAELAEAEFRGQFADHWEMALMDYDGSLESAPQTVEISLFDPTELGNLKHLAHLPLLTHEKSRWQTRQEMMDYYLSSRNVAFSFHPQEILMQERIDVFLQWKRQSS